MNKFIFFTADHCSNCKIVKQWIRESDADIEIYDCDIDIEHFVDIFRVKALPTTIKLNSEGREIDRMVGNFQGKKENFLHFINN